MERTISANLGGKAFVFNESAYVALRDYLDSYERGFKVRSVQATEVRIAEIFTLNLSYGIEIVDYAMVVNAVNSIGGQMPNSYRHNSGSGYGTDRLYRNEDTKIIAGVCSGLADYLKIDVVVVRVLMAVFVLFWLYVILWIVVPVRPLAGR
ncbi:MAG: PspC domain-containing protein [Rikenellaceae bacterium]